MLIKFAIFGKNLTIKGEIMNKNELVDQINKKSGLTKQDCKLCLDVIIEIIKDSLKNGDSVTLSNFGKFKVNNAKPKTLYSFKTGQTYTIEERKTPVFKASESLKCIVK